MKRTFIIRGAVVWTAATLLLVLPASANIDASQSWTTANPPKTAKAPSWQRVAMDHVKYDHTEGDHCDGPTCGKSQCYDAKNKLWLCKADKSGKPGLCTWHQNGQCDNNKPANTDISAGSGADKGKKK